MGAGYWAVELTWFHRINLDLLIFYLKYFFYKIIGFDLVKFKLNLIKLYVNLLDNTSLTRSI